SCEAETAAALDDLGHAIDCDELVDEFAVALFAVLAVLTRTAPFLCHCPFPFSFPGAIGRLTDVAPVPRTEATEILLNRARALAAPVLSDQKLSPPSRAASARALTRP